MLKKLNILLLILACTIAGYAQDITATVKTVSSVAPGKDFTVEITVNKAGISGFMKYFQELPANYTAADLDSKGGNFTFADNGAKIIWISPPGADQFVITYKITVPAAATGTISIGGKFSYVMGNERKVFDIVPQAVNIGGTSSAPAPVPVKTEPVKETVTKESTPPAEIKPTVAETPKPTPVAETPKPAEVKKETPAVNTKPAPVPTPTAAAATSTPGRTYKVQIGAFSQKPHIDGVSEPSTLQLDNGMTKYFSGSFKTYDEAVKRKKEMIEKGFSGAFIVAFENGKIVK